MKGGPLPKFGVRIGVKDDLPDGVEILGEEDSVEGFIFQPYAYPRLKTKCDKCGRKEHLEDECSVKPYLVALIGPAKGNKREMDISSISQSMDKLRMSEKQGNPRSPQKRSYPNLEGLVMKVGIFLKRDSPGGGQLWMPTQGHKTSFPLSYIDVPQAGADCLLRAWKTADRKIHEMLKFDFPGLSEELIVKLDLDMTKKLVAHQLLTGSAYVYLVGLLKVEASFDSRAAKQHLWIPVNQLAETVRRQA